MSRRQLHGVKAQLARVPTPVWYGIGFVTLLWLLRAPVKRAARALVEALLTADTLRRALPNIPIAKITANIGPLIAALAEAKINTPKRIAAFLAQLGHESGDFRYFEELASGAAYEGRSDLGNTQPGDGKRYKGRGPIQLTGRANYRAFTKDIGKTYGVDFEENPELVAEPKWGFKAAAWYWNKRGLNAFADKGDFDAITYRINGGYNGKSDRDARYTVARTALGVPTGTA